jgi:hypothetical protein
MSQNQQKNESATKLITKILQGHIPNFKNLTQYYVTLFALISFYMFVIWKVSLFTIAIPGLSYLKSLFSKPDSS